MGKGPNCPVPLESLITLILEKFDTDTGFITVTLNKYTILSSILREANRDWELEGGVDRDKKAHDKRFIL